ncbi:MAG: hypothetical protein CMC88_05660 [Flavobacteriaceae bacterium]|nr:hypothetical protein [Flavobacteriaceae bacterium]|tara:strand:+ start:17829 stop:18194 length:366 start_codon:yes stop_codon:yes gene_type:complete
MKIKSNPYLTSLTIVFGLLFFNIFFENKILFYITIVISGLSIFWLKFSILIERCWFKVAYLLSQIIPNILLTLIFFLLLTPLSILSKIFGSKTNFKSINNNNSVFKLIDKSFNKKSFERTW